ncbi:MAG: hypothetical protein V2A73_07020 [Pseudomonadota bacterium]
MRVTESRLHDIATSSLTKARSEVARSGAELSSGIRVQRPSDDPVAFAEGARVAAKQTIANAHKSSIARSRERLQATEGALQTIGDTLLRITELAIQGANETCAGTARISLAVEIRELRQAALNAVNTQAEDGTYLFGSFGNDTPPFDAAATYAGGTATRQADVGPGLVLPASLPGSVLTTLAGPSAENVFGVIDNIEAALAADNGDGVTAELDRLQRAVRQVALARGSAGGYVQALETAEETRAKLMESLVEIRARAISADPIEAATSLAKAENSLEAARLSAQELLAAAALGGR